MYRDITWPNSSGLKFNTHQPGRLRETPQTQPSRPLPQTRAPEKNKRKVGSGICERRRKKLARGVTNSPPLEASNGLGAIRSYLSDKLSRPKTAPEFLPLRWIYIYIYYIPTIPFSKEIGV